MTEHYRAGFTALLGRPSVGKSALVNTLTGYKTSIVSPLPQTTRNTIRGIVTREEGQVIFLDTPGLHKSDKKFNHYMMDAAKTAAADADAVLYVTDLSRPVGEEEKDAVKLLAAFDKPKLIALNKIDKQEARFNLSAYFEFLDVFLPGVERVEISAQKQINIDKLFKQLLALMPEAAPLYDNDIYTDQPPAFRIAETLREKTIANLREEVPHSVYVEVADLEMHGNKLWARCFIMTEREQQKGMIIGRDGLTLRKIRVEALKELKTLFPYPVELDIKVKVDAGWRKNDRRLKALFI
jgi:GTP-binding protein Era